MTLLFTVSLTALMMMDAYKSLEKIQYTKLAKDQLQNELKDDPTIKREQSLQGYLRKLKKHNCFENDADNNIYPVGSQTARIYALPKMHKLSKDSSQPPFRPIILTIGIYNYKLAKYLSNLLSPYIPKFYSTCDSFSFVEELKKVDITNKYIVSYDVESLFTNIPLNETIDIATEFYFKDKTCLKYFSKAQLKKLLQISTSGSHFLFNRKYYD
ncbi:uncharacterized protein LOC136079262 [Hydra vulgaris]|uniref:Uncharacterized protein LOC136079262 n=1 Tax=Hydra vulgaris TaxID=6087 RepID=A0ABM4BPL8_HYDVU